MSTPSAPPPAGGVHRHGVIDRIVGIFLNSNLALVLVLLSVVVGVAALLLTAREEDPQIVVPMADVLVSFPGHSAAEVEQLVATPLEKLLYQIDGVEYVYSISRPDSALITVRFYVGEDRERSLVKLYKRIDEHVDIVPPGVTGWVVKPVEIDDVPIVTLTLTSGSADEATLRRVGEELVERLAAIQNTSRVYLIGGPPRQVHVRLAPDRLEAYGVSALEVRQALAAANVVRTVGTQVRDDLALDVLTGPALTDAWALRDVVVRVADGRPVFLKDVADVVDGPAERTDYVRHRWGPARSWPLHHGFPGTTIGASTDDRDAGASQPAVTIAVAKQKGTNAVWVAEEVLETAERLRREVVPADMDLVITRNAGLTADEKVNELVEALGVAVIIVIALLTIGLGWREALVVAVAVPVVFGLTLAVNLLVGYTINRVTLFALILSLGLLVDDPIVDVENIARHFGLRRRASRPIVLEAVAEIRPPLITATLAVIVSFLPMFFITGMMGPYMRPMALNVPVTMIMSMVVAFTITPWMAYHALKRRYATAAAGGPAPAAHGAPAEDDLETLRRSRLYRLFYPLMAPLLHSRRAAWAFLGVMALLMIVTGGMAALRMVPLKMLPFDNKNELLLVLDFPEGTTLERSDAAVRDFERYLAAVPEVVDLTAYVGTHSPIDFNGLVRHYYLRGGPHVAELRINLVAKKNRAAQSHAIGLRLREDLTALAARHAAALRIVESPPGPPVIAAVVAEVRGRPDHSHDDLLAAARTVRARLALEQGAVDLDDSSEAPRPRRVFVTDQEKAALHGITLADVAATLEVVLGGAPAGTLRQPHERNPLPIIVRLPEALRSTVRDLGRVIVKGRHGDVVPLGELGRWDETPHDQPIYHKNLERVVYVFADVAGRTPAEVVVDVQADRRPWAAPPAQARQGGAFGSGWIADAEGRALGRRNFVRNGAGVDWAVPDGITVDFAGEGEWQITLDVFRDLGLAFGAALVGIYILLVAQTGSFVIPVVVMLAIPLTIIGIMPGFWLLNLLVGGQVGPFADPVLFTATGMIGMIALSGIVTRDSIILVDFIHLSLARGRSLFDAIMESRVVRLRPILLTTGAAMLGAAPIVIDPIFSGLAWALIFGLLASTVFTLFVIPVAYWLLYERVPGHGLPRAMETE
jgi:multidrug efflux pump subunit AcrB